MTVSKKPTGKFTWQDPGVAIDDEIE